MSLLSDMDADDARPIVIGDASKGTVPNQHAMVAQSKTSWKRLSVVIASSRMLQEDLSQAQRLADVVNRAYGCRRLSVAEVQSRYSHGDAGCCANRV